MEFTVDAMIRGYHEYRQIWEAEDGEVLQCQRETGNRHDLYAVATVKNDVIVGHVPRLISSLCSIFIRRGGSITCTVTGRCRYSADLVQGGIEIPCKLTFITDSETEYNKTRKLVEDALSVKLSSSSKTSAGIKLGTQKDDADSSILNDDALIKIEDVDIQADQPPPSKKCKIDFEAVIMGEILTDVHINLAQTLLKSQFDQLNGLNNTLYQARKVTLTKDTVANKLQIIHCKARSHWIVATTVKCTPGTVKV